MDYGQLARMTLLRTSPEYAEQRFSEIITECIKAWGKDREPFLAVITNLSDDERGKAILICDLTNEWTTADESRIAEIEAQANETITELERAGVMWLLLLLDAYAPEGSKLRTELDQCVRTMPPHWEPEKT